MSIFQFLRNFDVRFKKCGLSCHFWMMTFSVKNRKSVTKVPYLWHVLGHSVLAQGCNEARWPRARSKFGVPTFEPEVLRKQMRYVEEGTFAFSAPSTVIRRPENYAPLVAPLHWLE